MVHDTKKASYKDLGTQFFLREDDVKAKKNRYRLIVVTSKDTLTKDLQLQQEIYSTTDEWHTEKRHVTKHKHWERALFGYNEQRNEWKYMQQVMILNILNINWSLSRIETGTSRTIQGISLDMLYQRFDIVLQGSRASY